MQYDLALAILGEGKTSYANAHDLLSDLASGETIVFLPRITGSLEPVSQAVMEAGIFYAKSDDIFYDLENTAASQKFFIVLGTEGLEKEIAWAAGKEIPVLDLTRGLYAVSQVPPDGSVSDSESPTAGPPTPDRVSPDLELERLTGLLGKKVTVTVDRENPQAVRTGIFLGFGEGGEFEIMTDGSVYHAWPLLDIEEEEKVRPHIAVAETKHYVNGVPQKTEEEVFAEELLPEKTEEAPEEKIRCYKAKGGKIRKADGRTKKRPGEEEVFLTLKEFEENK